MIRNNVWSAARAERKRGLLLWTVIIVVASALTFGMEVTLQAVWGG